MKRHPRKKVKLTIYIDTQLREKVDSYISRNYAKPYGSLSEVAEEALAQYIKSSEDPTHTQTHKKAPRRGHESAIEVCMELWNSGITLQFRQKDIIKAIKKTRGFDKRTIEKWHKILVEGKYVVLVRPPFIYEYGPASGLKRELEEGVGA